MIFPFQKTVNLTLPEWFTDEVYRKMQEIVFLELEIRAYTIQLKRLDGGFIMKKFIDNMNPKGDPSNKPSHKIYIYSGHDINIVAFYMAHNINSSWIPDYGSAFIVEKLRKGDHNFYVRVISTRLVIVQLLLNWAKS